MSTSLAATPSARKRVSACRVQIIAVAVGDDGNVAPVAKNSDFAERDAFARVGIGRQPLPVFLRLEVAHRIERDRLDDDDDAAFLARQAHAFAQHFCRIGAVGRTGDDDPRDVAQRGDRIVVMKVPAKPSLIAEARDAHDHRIGILAVGEERQRRRLAADLVLGVVDIGEELDFRDRR